LSFLYSRVHVCTWKMGNFAPSNRDNELRVEKLYLLADLAEKLDVGTVTLEDYIGLFWQFLPERVECTRILLQDLIKCRREGIPYTQDDWARFKDVCNSGSSREMILKKLLHMGVIEKKNKTIKEYEIRLSDKWIKRLEYLTQSWVILTR